MATRLFYPAAQETIYLIDNCGRIVHEWSDTLYQPGNAVYLMDNGDVVRCGRRPGILNPAMERGGAGEMVDRRDWNGQLIWRYTYNDALHRMHHDVAMLPNGNVLILAWELKTAAEAAQAGRDTIGSGGATVWPDHIIEVEPLGIDSGNVVWAVACMGPSRPGPRCEPSRLRSHRRSSGKDRYQLRPCAGLRLVAHQFHRLQRGPGPDPACPYRT